MLTPNNLTKKQWLALADGVARGDAMLTISGAVGIDRVTLRVWLAQPGMLDEIARRIGSPSSLGDETLARLFSDKIHFGERDKAYELRRGFADALMRRYPEWFAARDAAAEKARAEEEDRRNKLKAEWDAEYERKEVLHRRKLECLRADYFNLSTLVIVKEREWRDGTPAELKRGLTTPDARRRYRCAHGLRWTLAGFGMYYSPKWSAARCRMKYVEADAGGGLVGFDAAAQSSDFDAAMEEIEAEERDYGEYAADPFVRRDPKLPTTEETAKALLAHVEAGGAFADWKPWKPQSVKPTRKRKPTMRTA